MSIYVCMYVCDPLCSCSGSTAGKLVPTTQMSPSYLFSPNICLFVATLICVCVPMLCGVFSGNLNASKKWEKKLSFQLDQMSNKMVTLCSTLVVVVDGVFVCRSPQSVDKYPIIRPCVQAKPKLP